MKDISVMVLIVLELALVANVLEVAHREIEQGTTGIGIAFGFMTVFFTSIGIALYATSDRTTA